LRQSRLLFQECERLYRLGFRADRYSSRQSG
jgi:hypothetical protein